MKIIKTKFKDLIIVKQNNIKKEVLETFNKKVLKKLCF